MLDRGSPSRRRFIYKECLALWPSMAFKVGRVRTAKYGNAAVKLSVIGASYNVMPRFINDIYNFLYLGTLLNSQDR